MLKLLRFNIKRILSSKTFWICSAAYILYGIIISLIFWDGGGTIDFPSANIGLSGSPLTGVILLIILSVIMGSDFKYNTIRNKILIGYSKSKIYLSNVLAFSICAIVLKLVYLCITLPISPTLLTIYLFDAIFHDDSSVYIAQLIVVSTLYNILTVAFFVSTYSLIIMNIKNTAMSIICGIIINISSVLVTWTFADLNAFELLYFYPTGINAAIANGDIVTRSIDQPALILAMTAAVTIAIAVTASVGAAIFDKSKIK